MKYLYVSDIDSTVITKSAILNSSITIISFIIKNFIVVNNNSILAYFVDNFLKIFATYICDICLVQKTFKINDKIKNIPYSNILDRVRYLFNLEIFYKFLIIIIITNIINTSIYDNILNHLKKYNKLQFKNNNYVMIRNILIQVLVNGFSTLMFVNIMKFKWAYIDYDDMYLTIIILIWFSLSILISVNDNKI